MSAAGFTLIEVVVAISLITVVAAALTTFLVSSIRVLRVQVDRQTASQLAADAWEQVAAIQTPPGESPTLPPTDVSTINGIRYTVTWQGTPCVRDAAVAATACAPSSVDAILAAGDVRYYRVLITVHWTGNNCPGGSCTYQTSTLVNTDEDPSFEVR